MRAMRMAIENAGVAPTDVEYLNAHGTSTQQNDVSETAAPWSELGPLHAAVTGAARRAFAELGVQGYVMCHLSHSYHAGACLYFTFAITPSGRQRTRSPVRKSRQKCVP